MFIDTLYGRININVDNKVICSPELQRLRSIRLCNINSPYITGGDSLNRFEHSIGTAYLAQEIAKQNTSNNQEQQAFILAALLHDIVTAPFGHSLDYLFETIKSADYEHANIFKMYLTGKTIPYSRNIYYNRKLSLEKVINHDIITIIIDILNNCHELSKYIDNVIDIDNIDNVYRFAYHVGLPVDKTDPLKIAQSLIYRDGRLIADAYTLQLYQKWYDLRADLYTLLLENPGEFVAKALLERCLIEEITNNGLSENDWILTDYELTRHILDNGNDISKKCIQRLMLMELPENSAIYVTYDFAELDRILLMDKLLIINDCFADGVFLHFIRDVNKTHRPLNINMHSESGVKEVCIGKRRDRYLIGFFSDNTKSFNSKIAEFKTAYNLTLNEIGTESIESGQFSFF